VEVLADRTPAGSGECWDFSMNFTDSQTSTLDTAQAPATQSQAGQWVQLTGVFNPLQVVGSHRGTLTLYVNGAQAAQFAGVPIWSTTPSGVLRMGAGFGGVTPSAGDVSDACVFYGALSNAPIPPQTTSDIQSLYDHGSGDGCAVLDGLYP
jgi:Concanavalin A-like lectin/glucanases superfamily